MGGADPYRQAVQALDNIAAALRDRGDLMDNVVRTWIDVTRREDAEPVLRAHRERLGHVRPAAALGLVAGRIDPALPGEIEVEAVVDLAKGEP